MEQSVGREGANHPREVRRQVQRGKINPKTRRGGSGLSSAHVSPTVAVDAPRGHMMMSPTAGGRVKLACPHRLLRRPAQEGVEHVTRSMATNRAQVSSSTEEPACDGE